MTPLHLALATAAGAAADGRPLVVYAVAAVLIVALLLVLVVSRLIAAPRALVEAGETGGVVIAGGADVTRLLRFGDPTLPTPDLHPYLVVDPTAEVLIVRVAGRRIEILWDEIRTVERRTVGLRGRSAVVVSVSRGRRPRSAVLRLVEEPGILGLRPAPEASVDRFHRRLLARIEAARPAPWGSR
ncbi:hypothetical protein Q0F99_20435 [Rathayibacter oskolensis]|uniref:hypothetical protein n=1 Tax=Rathayibacter TaxID=33886 RepID=UPI0013174DC4|nr:MULTISPECIES: hypothetical protein [Rathayibacter]QHC67011.1 hypothetical protein GSU68_10865 [Rathayibacter sp. VKM Ac-2759]WKK71634.1 hypothetical protein Q0F99_20435 [Rathayibacter oskolensis]